MFAVFGSLVDFVHALAMAGWVLGLPLLFWHRHPRASRAYAIYSLVFIVLNQASKFALGECFLTTIARAFWEHGGAPPRTAPSEWFTVRVAMVVFKMTPSHRSITMLSELLIFVCALGMLRMLRKADKAAPGRVAR